MEHGLKAGIYKIISSLDQSVLTVAAEGASPHHVKSCNWESLNTQKWKVRVRSEGENSIQIIRNETLKDNEVSKKLNPGENGFVQVDWKFSPASEDNKNLFLLNNGVGFLTNNGCDERISFGESVDGALNQQWEFEFIAEIEKEK